MERDEYNREVEWVQARYEAIEHRAEEIHVAYLVRELAIEQERTYFAIRGEPEHQLVQGVDLVGEYPDTSITIRVWDRMRNKDLTRHYPVWHDMWISPAGTRYPPSRLAGDMLVWARGG